MLVLTGLRDEQLGADAVGFGAQDYLVKDLVDGPSLARAVRYAVERRRSDRVRRALRDARLRADENARLERGLLPTPLIEDPEMRVLARYEPGTEQTLLGGDFYDVVEGSDGTLHAVIGDVCGHGPDEAALGVSLRIAWRTLVLSGIDPDRVLPTMHELLVHERNQPTLFTTLAAATVEPGRERMTLRLAGHPPPALVGEGQDTSMLSTERLGLPLGVGDGVVLDAARGASCPRNGRCCSTPTGSSRAGRSPATCCGPTASWTSCARSPRARRPGGTTRGRCWTP